MATMTQDDLLEAIDKMTVLELSEFIKRFEERYGVTAAAPVAAAAARGPAGQAGRRDAGAGGHARRPARRPVAQPGLCPAAGRRAEGEERRLDTAVHWTTHPIPTPTFKETPRGSPDPGRPARSDRQDDRSRAVRFHQALRGALRRYRRGPGCGRRRPDRRRRNHIEGDNPWPCSPRTTSSRRSTR